MSASPARRSCRARSTSRCWRRRTQRRPYPLVLIHGAAQTATNWMGTPDGRKGWAEYFVEQGYVVYMIDQPMRGRSAWHPGDGATRMFTAKNEQFQFTAIETDGTWPRPREAHAMAGRRAEQGQEGRSDLRCVLRDAGRDRDLRRGDAEAQPGRRRGAARQDRPGDRADPFAVGTVRLADRRRAAASSSRRIIAIEPSGPPFESTIIATGKARAWGVDRHPDDLRSAGQGPERDRGRARGEGRRARPVRVLDAEGAGASARQPQGHPVGDHRGRGVLPPALRPLHREISQPGRHEDRMACRCRSTASTATATW